MSESPKAGPGAACGIYYRVSTFAQDTASQKADVRRYVKARGWHAAATAVYEEKESTRNRRPELARLIADARARRFRAVVVWSVDRFGRGLSELVNNVKELMEAGIEFAAVKQALDMSTPTGRLTFHIIAAMAEWERDMIAERIRAGVAAARTKRGGQWGRRPKPFDIAEARRLLKATGSIRAAAKALGVSRATFRRRLATHYPRPKPLESVDSRQTVRRGR